MRRILTCFLVVALAILWLPVPLTSAATITVGGACTLIDAIIAANTDAVAGGCTAGSGADTLVLTASVNLTTFADNTQGLTGLPPVTSTIMLIGNGFTIQRTAGPDFRLLYVSPSGSLTLENVTLAGGVANEPFTCPSIIHCGGAVRNDGTLNLNNTTITGNSAEFGGGIYNHGIMTAANSTFSNNTADTGLGGGLFNDATLTLNGVTISGNSAGGGAGLLNLQGTMTINNSTISNNTVTSTGDGAGLLSAATTSITNSTFSNNTTAGDGGAIYHEASAGVILSLVNSTLTGNSARNGGGIYNNVGTVNVSGSTLTGNSATIAGGGIYNETEMTITNSTLSGNTAFNGGGIRHGDGIGATEITTINSSTIASNSATVGSGLNGLNGTVHLSNSIFANNFSGQDCELQFVTVATNTNNLIETQFGGCVGAITADPGLNGLADNGGATLTHLPIPTSPVVNAGVGCPAADQRGVARPQGAGCDIGAVEVTAAIYNNPVVAFQSATSTTTEQGLVLTIPVTFTINPGPNFIGTIDARIDDSGTGTALAGIDYTFASQTLTFDCTASCAPGTQTQNVTLTILTDAIPESAETVNLGITITGSASLGTPATHTVTIDEPITATVAFDTAASAGVEGNSVLIPVSLSVTSGLLNGLYSATINYSGTATNGTDYAGTAVIGFTCAPCTAAGSPYTTTVIVTLTNDGTLEGIETALLTLSNPGGVGLTIGTPGDHTLTIAETTGTGTVSFAAPTGTGTEGNSILIPIELTVTGGSLAGLYSVDVTYSGTASNGTDYTGTTVAVFTCAPCDAAGSPYTTSIIVALNSDGTIEGAETILLNLANPSGTGLSIGGQPDHTFTLQDSVPTPGTGTPSGGSPAGGSSAPGGTGSSVATGFIDSDYLTKAVDRPLAQQGEVVTYTINAHNPKPVPLTQVVIYDVFDARLTEVRLLSTSKGSSRFAGNTLVVSGFTLQPGETMTIVVQARVAVPLAPGEVIPNAAILESPDASIHVSNAVTVGRLVQGNGGSGNKLIILPDSLPLTGEAPLWRTLLLIMVAGLFIGVLMVKLMRLNLPIRFR